MRFALDSDQEALRREARRFFAGAAGGDTPAMWPALCELGWPAVLVPEPRGGLGLGWVEQCVLAEEAGRALAPVPYLANALAVAALLETGGAGDDLAAIAAGELTAAAGWMSGETALAVRRAGDGFALSGDVDLVAGGDRADVLVLAAGDAVFRVPADAAGLDRRRLPTLDATRPLARLALCEVAVPHAARLGDRAALDVAIDRAGVALAAECVGGAEVCLEMARSYALERHQFGRPIGSFQAIKHTLADMVTAVETARSAAYYAAWALDAGEPDALDAARCARAHCTRAFYDVAAQAIQVHGGIGFTWEHDVHRYFKRARAARTLLGEPAALRDRIAADLGLDGGAP